MFLESSIRSRVRLCIKASKCAALALGLVEIVDDIESLATEEKADLFECNDSGETEKNILAHHVHSSDEALESAEEYDDLPHDKAITACMCE